METWLLLGIGASVFFGVSALLTKVALSSNYYGLSPQTAAIFGLLGMAVAYIPYFLIQGSFAFPGSRAAIAAAIGAGFLVAVGTIFTFIALKNGADISRLTPIYNTNTIVAVALAILLLHELPTQTQAIKVVVGAILIVIGGLLVAL